MRSRKSAPACAADPCQSFAKLEAALVKKHRDRLSELPKKGFRYVDAKGRRLFDDFYDFHPQRAEKKKSPHPKLVEAEKAGQLTRQLQEWYGGLEPGINIPIAGVSRELCRGRKRKRSYADADPDCVDRADEARRAKIPGRGGAAEWHALAPLLACLPAVGQLGSAAPATHSREVDGRARFADPCPPLQEDSFHSRPSIKLLIPDQLKALLVDDWENVTKNQQLVPLPHANPVTKILDDYMEHERPRRAEGSAALDILEETVAGLREYFDKCLGRILLYRYGVSPLSFPLPGRAGTGGEWRCGMTD